MEPVKFGSKYAYSRTGNYLQIVDPAINTKGVVLRTINLIGAKLFTGQVKPNWANEDNFPLVLRAGSNDFVICSFQIELPAGYGLWINGTNDGYTNISYDLLS